MSQHVRKFLLMSTAILTIGSVGAYSAAQTETPATSAVLNAPRVNVLMADLGPMARIEFHWPQKFLARADTGRQRIDLFFDQPFNAPDLGALRQRLGHWITGISKQANTISLTLRDSAGIETYTDGNVLVVELMQTAFPATTPSAVLKPVRLTRPAKKTTATLVPPSQRPAKADNGPVTNARDQAKSRLRLSRQRVTTSVTTTFDRQRAELVVQGSSSSPANNAPAVEVAENKSGVTVSGERIPSQLQLQINWGRNVGLTTDISGRELLIRTDRPLDPDAFSKLGATYPEWLTGVSTGYDTLLFVARNDVAYDVTHSGSRTRINIRPVTASTGTAAPQSTSEKQTATRLELLRARLKARQGKTDTARKKLEKLRADNPKNNDIALELASLHRSVGSWRSASGLYDSILARTPGQFDAAQGRSEIRKQHADRIRIDHDAQFVEDGDEQQITVISGHVNVAKQLRLGLSVENRHLDDDQVQRVNGAITAENLSRQRGEFYAQYETAPGQRVTGAVLIGPASPGLSLGYTWQSAVSQLTVQGDWHRAHWDFVEGIVDNAVRDGIGMRYSRQLDQRWSAELALGYNRFSIDTIDNAATTISTEASVNYLLPIDGIKATIGYSVSGQYLLTVEKRLNQGGDLFRPLPATSSEIHSLNFSVAHRFSDTVFARAFASLSRDRYEIGLGPTFGGELNWEISQSMEMGLRGSHSRISGRGDQAVFTRLGGFLLYRF